MSDEALASFIHKWRARWPEWALAEVFVPHPQREAALAWMALVQELTDAAWGGSDPRPGEAKLGWWMEELQGWSRGMRRHPLGQALQKASAAWPQLAASLPALRDSRERPMDAADARGQMRLFAQAVAAVEQDVFGHSTPEAEAVASNSLLCQRLAHHPDTAVPLQVQARSGEGGAPEAWALELGSQPRVAGAPLPRRLLAALARARVRRGAAARPLSAPAALWTAWRAARG